MKRNKLIISVVACIIALLLTGCFINKVMSVPPKNNARPSDYDAGVTYEQAAKLDKPVIAVFYVDWCKYCMHFMPILDHIRRDYKDSYSVILLNAEDEKNEKLAKDYMISGFPTVYIMDPKYDNRIHIDGGNYSEPKKFRKELDRYLRIRDLIKKGSEK